MNLTEWKSQVKRGVLEYIILMLIQSREYYGYEIIATLKQYESLSAKESTIYPLLKRLEKEQYLESIWKDVSDGLPPRKYYQITKEGKKLIKEMKPYMAEIFTVIKELEGE